MSDKSPKTTPVSMTGANESDAIRLVQEFSSGLGLTLKFEAGSNVAFYIYMPGCSMKEQLASQTTTAVGNIQDSTVGSIGPAGDVNVSINGESSQVPDGVELALKNARQELRNLTLNARSKSDVGDYLDRIANEMRQPEPDQSRLKNLFVAIKDIASPVAAALSIAASLTKLLGS
jgi:hypothetical protein